MNSQPWWEQDWYVEWKKLAARDYHGRPNIPLFGYDDVERKIVEALSSLGKRTAPFNKESGA